MEERHVRAVEAAMRFFAALGTTGKALDKDVR
jgi:hypothetical protein